MEVLQIAREWASPAILTAFLGWVGIEVWSGYKEHKKDVYAKIHQKVDKTECKEFRKMEERVMDVHREEGHHDK